MSRTQRLWFQRRQVVWPSARFRQFGPGSDSVRPPARPSVCGACDCCNPISLSLVRHHHGRHRVLAALRSSCTVSVVVVIRLMGPQRDIPRRGLGCVDCFRFLIISFRQRARAAPLFFLACLPAARPNQFPHFHAAASTTAAIATIMNQY